MSVINANPLMLGDAGYNIGRSLRFRSSASAYLSRTFGTPTNQKIWTYSFWFKRGALGVDQLFLGQNVGTNQWYFRLDSGAVGTKDTIIIGDYNNIEITTTPVLRDPSAWYHIILAFDTTQATATNRVKLYINGVQQSYTQGATFPAQNSNPPVNQSGLANNISGGLGYLDGYLAEVNFIDGQALTPSSFGQTDPVTGVWQPKKYTGTYGTNGFYLPFSDNTSATTLAYDKSGNGNNWTPNNISTTAGATYDSMTDVPTLTSATAANYCVLNPLTSVTATKPTIANGNLTITGPGGSNRGAKGTQQITYKSYWEVTITASGSGNSAPGIASGTALDTDYTTGTVAVARNNEGNFYVNGTLNPAGSGAPFGAFAAGSIIMLAYDPDTSRLWMGKNGTWFNSGSPASGTGYVTNTSLGSEIYPFCSSYNEQQDANFGQRPFSYTPPTGFVALNTFNLPDPTIKKGNQYMDATLWTGNNTGTSRSITGISFQPDMLWLKDRSRAYSHIIYDSIRGAGSGKALSSNLTDAEGLAASSNSDAVYGYVSSFDANGFTATNGTDPTNPRLYYNYLTDPYVAWSWKKGATPGFDIVTYTGNGDNNRAINHSLGVVPKMIITKSRSASYTYPRWYVYHASMPSQYLMYLDTTDAQSYGQYYYSANPTSSVFTVGNDSNGPNVNSQTYVSYLWAEIAGFSKFGSYTGNGSADGPFVYCGFRPKYVMVKRTDTTGGWEVMDAARNPSNQVNYSLSPNFSDAEYSIYAYEDFVSNGFKLRTTDPYWNANGGTYIYAAFAESPFKFANAR